MNIQMRIITEDNIDQLMNLSYQSRNIDKLLYIDHGETGEVQRDIQEIIDNYKKKLDTLIITTTTTNKKLNEVKKYSESPDSPESPEYAPGSPAYAPETPEYAPGSPAYAPETPEYAPGSPAYAPESPEYAPGSPAYAPNSSESPEYAPGSPAYAPTSPPETVGKFTPHSPDFPPPPLSKGGATNIFNNDHMNKVFDNLNSEIKSQILKLNNPEQIVVMMEIIRQTSQKNMDNNIVSTKILPTSAADDLYKEMPILTVETNNNDKQSDTLLSNNTSNNTTSNTSGASSIKKVSII
jgi:hypothetical protein